MKLYNTSKGIIIQEDNQYYLLKEDWDQMVNTENLHDILSQKKAGAERLKEEKANSLLEAHLLPPIGSQEVWAAGVTYMQSRNARREESKEGGGGDFYDKVYDAERPELFFKALPHRVAGHQQEVYIREDSTWNVPEPELTLFINSQGTIAGYTVGNDMSSRSIEGENPLYLPQAKVYERSAGLGPCLLVPDKPIPLDTSIEMKIFRKKEICFEGTIQINQMKRSLKELAGYLNRGFDFPYGSYLMTGTCLVPENDFTLHEEDIVEIRIEHIGTLVNKVAVYRKVSSNW